MGSHRILVTTNYLEPGGEVDHVLTAAGFEVAFSRSKDRRGTPNELVQAMAGVNGVVAGTDAFTAELFKAAPDLRIIARTGAGYDNIDLTAARERGVVVCATPGANSHSVAELTIGLLLDCARSVSGSAAEVRSGAWLQTSGRQVRGATLGILGFGRIGQEVATIGRAMGMLVIAYDPFFDSESAASIGVEYRGFESLLEQSDAVSIHLGLTEQTRGMVDEAAIARMKSTAFLINTARGGIVDEGALARALVSGDLAAAALDVVETEPLPLDSPLRSAPNVTITPHVAGATVEARAVSSHMAAGQVVDFFAGRPVAHRVDCDSKPAHMVAASEEGTG